MPLSPTGLNSLTTLQREDPARLDRLLAGVRAGTISADTAAQELPGVTAADLTEAALKGLDSLAQNRDAQALGRAGQDAPATFGGIRAGGTLAAKGLFGQTIDAVSSAQGALQEASTRKLSLPERVRDLMPEYRGGLGRSLLKGLAIGLAAGAGGFFVNPLLAPVLGLVGVFHGLKSNAVEGSAGKLSRDPVTAEEGAALKASFDAGSDVEKGAIAAAVVRFDRAGLEIAPEAARVLDDIAAHASSPDGQRAERFLAVGVEAQAIVTALASKRRKKKGLGPPDAKPLTEALRKLSPAELDEARPFLWDALHDKKGYPLIVVEGELEKLLYSERSAGELAATMVAAFCVTGSSGGENVTAKEVNLLLALLERFPSSVSQPALLAVGEQLATLAIEPDAARIMANVLDAISPPQA